MEKGEDQRDVSLQKSLDLDGESGQESEQDLEQEEKKEKEKGEECGEEQKEHSQSEKLEEKKQEEGKEQTRQPQSKKPSESMYFMVSYLPSCDRFPFEGVIRERERARENKEQKEEEKEGEKDEKEEQEQEQEQKQEQDQDEEQKQKQKEEQEEQQRQQEQEKEKNRAMFESLSHTPPLPFPLPSKQNGKGKRGRGRGRGGRGRGTRGGRRGSGGGGSRFVSVPLVSSSAGPCAAHGPSHSPSLPSFTSSLPPEKPSSPHVQTPGRRGGGERGIEGMRGGVVNGYTVNWLREGNGESMKRERVEERREKVGEEETEKGKMFPLFRDFYEVVAREAIFLHSFNLSFNFVLSPTPPPSPPSLSSSATPSPPPPPRFIGILDFPASPSPTPSPLSPVLPSSPPSSTGCGWCSLCVPPSEEWLVSHLLHLLSTRHPPSSLVPPSSFLSCGSCNYELEGGKVSVVPSLRFFLFSYLKTKMRRLTRTTTNNKITKTTTIQIELI